MKSIHSICGKGLALILLVITCFFALIASGGYVAPGPQHRCPQNPKRIYPCKCESGDSGVALKCSRVSIALASAGLSAVPFETKQLLRSQYDATEKPPASVDSLVLSDMHVQRLKGGDFLRPLVGLRSLLVTNTLELVSVEEGFFPKPINASIQIVRFINTSLEEFPSKAFQHLGNVSFLEISGHNITALAKDVFMGELASSALEKLHITRGMALTSLDASTFSPLRRLKTLNLSSNAISSLPRGCFRSQREALESLDLSGNRLGQLQTQNFADLTRLVSLNLSNNDIAALPRGVFARNALLRVLDLRRNKISALDPSLLRGLRFLRRLRLSDNALTEIGRGAFESAIRIGTVDLARNSLSIVPARAFAGLRYAEEINLSSNHIHTIESGAFKDLFLVQIDLSHNELREVESESFVNCANMTLLDLSHNQLERLRNDAMDEISYAGELVISYNKISDFSSLPIANMTGLRFINISNNLLNEIPRNSFPTKGLGLPELHTIDMSRNNISSISNGVFVPLLGLRRLLLMENALHDLGGSVFGAMPSMLHLSLRSNQLANIARSTFTRCASLRTLDLSNNSLTTVAFAVPPALADLDLSNNEISDMGSQQSPWPPMNALLTIDLSGNQLGNKTLSDNAFANLLTVRTLNLEQNGFHSIPQQALARLGSLALLSLANNKIEVLGRRAMGYLPVISSLSFANNSISKIEPRAFDGLLQLLHLDLSANNISYLKNDVFQGLVSLNSLDLSQNQIERLDNKTNSILEDCLSLQKLNLSYNRISFINRKTFPSSPYIPYKLLSVDLSHNAMPALTSELNVGTNKVQVLNVSHNLINEIRGNVLGNLTSVRVLDLSNNDLRELEISKLPLNLTVLRISGNGLKDLPKVLYSYRLNELDLRHNSLMRFHHELMPMIENGTRVLYEGNPISCTCTLRPLHRWLDSSARSEIRADWSSLTCSSPSFLVGSVATEVSEEKLSCPEPFKQNQQLDITPDVKLRKVERKDPQSVFISWYVTTQKDIGEFSLLARELGSNSDGSEAEERQRLPYSARSVVEEMLPSDRSWELCLLARDSQGNPLSWKESQCTTLTSAATQMNNNPLTIAIALLYIFFSTLLKI